MISPAALAVIPETPPPANSGRVVIEVVGDKAAKVYDVTAVTELTTTPAAIGTGKSRAPILVSQRTMHPLCITPCAADLPQGWHTLVFESAEDSTRTSVADVTVPAQPIAVRHALGHQQRPDAAYVTGVALVASSIVMVVAGGALAIGGASGTATDPTSASSGLLTTGLILLGTGAAFGMIGGILASSSRPEQQPGSTAQWVLPR